MEQPTVQFTHDGIPPLPEAPDDYTATPLTPDQQLRNMYAPQPVQPTVFTGPQQQEVSGIPLFEVVAVKRPDGKFMNVEFVTILTPGDTKSSPRRKVTDGIRQKYAAYYDMWRRGLETSPVGTPLEMWPALTPAQIMALKSANIFTVEQVSDVADVNLHRVPLGDVLRRQAKQWLALKKDADAISQSEGEKQLMRDTIAQQGQEIAALAETIKALQTQLLGDKTKVEPAKDEVDPETLNAPDTVPAPDNKPAGKKSGK